MDPCRAFFDHMHVDMPALPEGQDARLKVLEKDALFGTRDSDTKIYEIDAFVREFIEKSPKEYVLIGTDKEHLHYYVVTEHVAIFMQLDTKRSADALSGELATLEYFLSAEPRTNERLVVIRTDRKIDQWAWIPKNFKDIIWHEKTGKNEILMEALLELKKK